MKKRKYTTKVKPEIPTETVQLKSSGVKYSDLPIMLRNGIEHIIEYRRRLEVFDDSVERKERAVRYYEWRQGA